LQKFSIASTQVTISPSIRID